MMMGAWRLQFRLTLLRDEATLGAGFTEATDDIGIAITAKPCNT
jgi:hypothetical protein